MAMLPVKYLDSFNDRRLISRLKKDIIYQITLNQENSMKSRREELREKRRRRQMVIRAVWIGAGAIGLALIAYFVWQGTRPAVGQSIPIMSDINHVNEGTDPGPYNSDPPTSGRHYPSEYDAGFYDESSPQASDPYPEGFLVHNLEHGYVIFWYNCDLLDENECESLKTELREVIDEVNNFKVIAFPRNSIRVPVVVTSWGMIQEFERFDKDSALNFYNRNLNNAPEPNAP
jgi:hypothetical protein